ncbi:MAG: signal peptidase II [Clostridia bacterium]|nr:signal peptidase II [Clostridia bacterium]
MKSKQIKFFILIKILLVIDQITKAIIVSNKESFPKEVIRGVLDFTYCENRGIAFGFASGHVRLFSIVTLIILAIIVIAVFKKFDKLSKLQSVGIAMLISGGIGNFIDRAFRSYVVDFIDFGKIINFPIFNIADIYVVCGVIIIGISFFIDNRSGDIDKNNR